MKNFDNFKVIERDDILNACQNVVNVMQVLMKEWQEENKEVTERIEADLNMVLAAAGVAAEVANRQGGLAMLPVELTPEQRQEVKKQLDKLRKEAERQAAVQDEQ